MQVVEASGGCPYCGEHVDFFVDQSEAGQNYIEDCSVCCRPIQVWLSQDADGQITISLFHENEVPGL